MVVPLPPMFSVANVRAPGTCYSPAVPVTCL
jgi:FtsZ-interacting cell division protein ZipA